MGNFNIENDFVGRRLKKLGRVPRGIILRSSVVRMDDANGIADTAESDVSPQTREEM